MENLAIQKNELKTDNQINEDIRTYTIGFASAGFAKGSGDEYAITITAPTDRDAFAKAIGIRFKEYEDYGVRVDISEISEINPLKRQVNTREAEEDLRIFGATEVNEGARKFRLSAPKSKNEPVIFTAYSDRQAALKVFNYKLSDNVGNVGDFLELSEIDSKGSTIKDLDVKPINDITSIGSNERWAEIENFYPQTLQEEISILNVNLEKSLNNEDFEEWKSIKHELEEKKEIVGGAVEKRKVSVVELMPNDIFSFSPSGEPYVALRNDAVKVLYSKDGNCSYGDNLKEMSAMNKVGNNEIYRWYNQGEVLKFNANFLENDEKQPIVTGDILIQKKNETMETINQTEKTNVLLVLNINSNELKAVTGQNADGTPETTAAIQENNLDFLKINKQSDKQSPELMDFFSNFLNQIEEPTDYRFFNVPLKNLEGEADLLLKIIRNPEQYLAPEDSITEEMYPYAYASTDQKYAMETIPDVYRDLIDNIKYELSNPIMNNKLSQIYIDEFTKIAENLSKQNEGSVFNGMVKQELDKLVERNEKQSIADQTLLSQITKDNNGIGTVFEKFNGDEDQVFDFVKRNGLQPEFVQAYHSSIAGETKAINDDEKFRQAAGNVLFNSQKKNEAAETTNQNKAIEAFLPLLSSKINAISTNPEEPWIKNLGTIGVPQNLEGKTYNGANSLMLNFHAEAKGFHLPVYLTFNQIKNEGLSIEKGEKALPILHFEMLAKNKETDKAISFNEYKDLSIEEKKQFDVIVSPKSYNVFNIEQTNVQKENPELWKNLNDKFNFEQLKDKNGVTVVPQIDSLINNREWIIPIYPKEQDRSEYFTKHDNILIPTKSQFKDGESFYANLLQEMTHSTGAPNRLNRNLEGENEQLVAELTAAVTAKSVGISTEIKEKNIQLLSKWGEDIKNNPDFLMSVLSDVNKAAPIILNSLENKIELDKSQSNTIQFENRIKNAIFNIKQSVEQKIPSAFIKSVMSPLQKGFDLLVYNNKMKFVGEINGQYLGVDDKWKLSTHTSKATEEVNPEHTQFLNKNIHGAKVDENQLILRNPEQKLINLNPQDQVDIKKINIFSLNEGGYGIRAVVNGEQQSAEKLSKEDIKSYFDDKSISAKDLAVKYFKGALEDNTQTTTNQIKK
ncbi:hypothetical protein FACS189451_03920 [Bacteroidia bacterium]|nr:hypothetical protein FACS189446_1720 [Bacteroidia bacterium]GHT61582.1 hypothetical protein FACS189451_03920 [Bacteroidia bacterium]